jgi:hypothetical protein
MKKFNFYLDEKVTTWYRTSFEIKASNIKDAEKKAIQFHLAKKTEMLAWQQIEGTEIRLHPKDNNQSPTQEIYNEDNRTIIWSNIKQ